MTRLSGRSSVQPGDEGYAEGVDPLHPFSSTTRAWFERAFAGPTPAQAAGWPAIATGGHVLIQAPTGSTARREPASGCSTSRH